MAPSAPSPTHVGYSATGGPAKRVRSNPAGRVTWERIFASRAGLLVSVPDFGRGAGRPASAAAGVGKYWAWAGVVLAIAAAIARENLIVWRVIWGATRLKD